MNRARAWNSSAGRVVGLDLRGMGVPGQPEIFHEFTRDAGPVDVGAGGEVGTVVPHRAVELAQDGRGRERVELAFETDGEDRHLLADGGGRGRLAVRAREHRHRGVLACEPGHRIAQRAHRRQQDPGAGIGEHQRVREVVDVLRRAREVDELAGGGELGQACHPLPNEVLDRLHVVVRLALDGLHPLRIVEREGVRDLLQNLFRRRGERCQRVELRPRRERPEPPHLDRDPISNQAELARDGAQRGGP